MNGCLLSKERPCDRQTYSLSTSHPAAADAIDYPMSTATGTKTETQLPKGGAAFPVEFDTLDPMIATSTVATPTITAPTTRKASTASTPSTGGENNDGRIVQRIPCGRGRQGHGGAEVHATKQQFRQNQKLTAEDYEIQSKETNNMHPDRHGVPSAPSDRPSTYHNRTLYQILHEA